MKKLDTHSITCLRTVLYFVYIVLRMTKRDLNTQTFYFVQCLALFTWVMSCNLQFHKFLCLACGKARMKYKHGLFYFKILVYF